MGEMPRQIVGGGTKKVLYTLNTIREIGVARAAKTLTAHNTCKACGLGMGGQRGGMTDELGDFPAVCNKSVQAQSSDTQRPVPAELFDHPIADFHELDGYELEHLGRLNTPLIKEPGADRYRPLDWDAAIVRIAERFAATDPARTFFYSSGRSSNEAGFLLQLIARAYGTNNVNNCSYYCHQATSVGLASTIGTGTSTVELADLLDCDLIFVIGANPASNHPRFIHKLKACRDRGGEVVVINPAREAGLVKFAVPKSAASMLKGGDEIASHYLQPRIGSDVALFKGIAKALIENGLTDPRFIERHCAGFAEFRTDIEGAGWDEITARTGIPRADIEAVAQVYGRARKAVFAWGMGMTHHVHGCDNVEYIANLALLRGMVGRRGAGLLPLRGHSNVQGIGTIGVKPVLEEDVFARIERAFGLTLSRAPGMDTLAGIDAAARGGIDAALMMGGNLFGATPNRTWAGQALGRIGFKLFLTTTLNEGHFHGLGEGEAIILPVTARDEEWEPTTQESMFNYVRLSDGGIARLDNVRPEVTILADIAAQLLKDRGIDFSAFKRHRRIREAIADIVPGMEELADIDVAKREFHVRGRILHEPVFRTADGRAHFRVRGLSETPKGEGGFTLTTVRSEGQFNTIIYERADTYRPAEDRWSVMMNAADMARLGIADGGKASLRSAHGTMENVTVHAFDIAAGGVLGYFPEANILAGASIDPRSKTPAFKSIAVEVVAA